MSFVGVTTTSDRLVYTHNSNQSDNNLGFMRVPYTSEDVVLTPYGLNGLFVTSETISYTTSFPALIQIHAQDGADVEIMDSAVTGGTLYKAYALLLRHTCSGLEVYHRYR